MAFNRTYESFTFAVKVLMFGYALSSRGEQRETMRRPLQSAAKHITTVEAHARSGAKIQNALHARAAEAEMAARKEWRMVGTEGPFLSLTDLIEIAGHRYTIWSTSFDLTKTENTPRPLFPDPGGVRGRDVVSSGLYAYSEYVFSPLEVLGSRISGRSESTQWQCQRRRIWGPMVTLALGGKVAFGRKGREKVAEKEICRRNQAGACRMAGVFTIHP